MITDDGREGVGYTYTGGFGGKAICSLIANELTHILIGKDASCVESIWEHMNLSINFWVAQAMRSNVMVERLI
ncbi:hypothetical protein [Paenibacillus etheri]|uniref:Mandelate racemase/muconate lactonizing enzyme N-terminal domain-containing protein n=1 Tax=Paenibacillus etheri TaxID=1306852 RepID=A0A0W1AWC2_9BACL|nr:hypothetical protein [Paenibacillus etheri]KTD85638.1 hypothetical protein UQ64_19280 [Paenibacillus etheri]